jgi:hypothetical protein
VTRRRLGLAIAAAVVVGGALRAVGLWSDFWLDEVWTWLEAQRLESPLEVFTKLHHSNNHHLNTLWIFALGDAPVPAYRLLAWLTGTASIALAAGVAARRGRLEAALAAALVALSFPLIHFSSEARGSGPVVAFALAAVWLLESDLERPRTGKAALFGACVVAGFLFQLVFLWFWAGALALSVWRLARRDPAPRALGLGLARLHAAPGLALAALWWVDLRQLVVGGGPAFEPAWFFARLFGYGFGLPNAPAAAWPYAAVYAALLGLALHRLARRGDDLWVLLLVAIALAPAAALAGFQPELVDVRYFLVPIALSLLAFALPLADGLRGGGARRAAAAAVLAAFAVGSSLHTARFLELGRGGYRAALRAMAEATPGPTLVVGSDHDFRTGSVLRFHARELSPAKRLDYRPRRQWPAGGPDWLVVHAPERRGPPQPHLTFPSGERFELVAEFDHGSLSGFWWALYRNTEVRRR